MLGDERFLFFVLLLFFFFLTGYVLIFDAYERELPKSGTFTSIHLHSHGYATVPGCWLKTDVTCFDCMAQLVVDHSVLVCVSNKLLKMKRRLCLQKVLQLCIG